MMIDSSRLWQTGVDYSSAKSLVDNALARPAKGVITGTWSINANIATLTMTVTNNSGVTLNAANNAAVHGIIYENIHAHKTNRIGRASGKVAINNLPNGETQTFTLDLSIASAVNKKNLVFLAVVDYKPGGKDTGVYDQIQAAQLDPKFLVSPSVIDFDFAWNDPTPTAQVEITGTSGLTWSATTNQEWLLVDPADGDIGTTMNVTVNPDLLAEGSQTGKITIVDGTNAFEREVTVNVKFQPFVPPAFSVFPMTITKTIRQEDTTISPSGLLVQGDSGQTWSATSDKPYVIPTPASGSVPGSLQFNFTKEGLVEGLNTAIVTFKDGGGYHEVAVTVKITYILGDAPEYPYSIYCPMVLNGE